jgi:hypothetical protein
VSATSPTSPRRDRLLLLATACLPLLASFLPAGRFLLPALAPLTLYGGFAALVRASRHGAAWGRAMAWAGLLFAGVVLLVALRPEAAAATVLNGEGYRTEMFSWIATGVGAESDWRAFLPQHLLHFGAFAALTWASAGYLGLVLGAVLMDYMSYFVASYALAAGRPLLGLVAAWVPWSVVRVAAFVLVGAVLARPLLARRCWPFGVGERRLLVLGLAGVAADLALKAWLAPAYGAFLRDLAVARLAP